MDASDLQKAIVYIVDDDAAVRRGIERLLRACGLPCRSFESARAYLGAILEPHVPACLVLDIRLPELSGTELQTLMRGTEREVPIIFVTGHGDIPTCVKALKAGAVSFLTKPFDESVLVGAVKEALELSVQKDKEHSHAKTCYDVFISYRRTDGSSTARLIQSELLRKRFRVFLDVIDLAPGHYDEAILRSIENSKHFVLILTPDALAPCGDRQDWLRREIACAIKAKKNIVPIMMPGFCFPEVKALPKDIQAIRVHQAITYSNEFFEAMIDKLVRYLQ